MDNARDEPLIVQLWLDLEKRFGWDRVGVIFAFSIVTVSLDVTLWERFLKKRPKRFLTGFVLLLIFFFIRFSLKNSLNLK